MAHLNVIIVLMLTLFIALIVCYSGGAKITVKGKHFLSVYETFMEITRQIGNRKDRFKSAVSLHYYFIYLYIYDYKCIYKYIYIY